MRIYTHVYTHRGAGQDLELLQETRLLHHQRPQVLRDTDTQSRLRLRGGGLEEEGGVEIKEHKEVEEVDDEKRGVEKEEVEERV